MNDNETLKHILTRRSVRNYKDTPVPDDAVEALVKSAIYAPSANNKQQWHFSVISEPETIEQMNIWVKEGMDELGIEKDEDFHVFYHAPLVIVLSSSLVGFSELNAGCAVENIAIAAKSLGLDTCIIGQTRYMYQGKDPVDINRALKIPEGYEHDVSICVGYAEGNAPDAKPRRKNIVDYIR
jgi:nitroreductase